jgi:hypothetical protein
MTVYLKNYILKKRLNIIKEVASKKVCPEKETSFALNSEKDRVESSSPRSPLCDLFSPFSNLDPKRSQSHYQKKEAKGEFNFNANKVKNFAFKLPDFAEVSEESFSNNELYDVSTQT